MLRAPSRSLTEPPLAMASPPSALIFATTSCAALLEPPLPSTAPPRSFTTTRAPRRASSSAWARPRPPPAPVTIATLPSKLTAMTCPPALVLARIVGPVEGDRRLCLLRADALASRHGHARAVAGRRRRAPAGTRPVSAAPRSRSRGHPRAVSEGGARAARRDHGRTGGLSRALRR